MKFVNFLQVSALAMAVGSASAAQPHSLRGPVMVSDKIANRASSSSKSSKDTRSGSRSASSSKSSKEKNSRGVSSSKSSKEPALPEDAANVPEFFPTDMDKELLDQYLANNPNKKSASQKRQEQRDERRSYDNPDRTQEEENKERARKTRQSESRGSRADPYNTDHGEEDFGRNREAKRIVDCERNRSSCNYSGPNSWCYTDCQQTRNGSDRANRACSEQCRYIEAGCYDFCRDDGDSAARCLQDCEINVDDDQTRRDIEREVDREDRSINRCEQRCDDRYRYDTRDWRDCIYDCDTN